MEPDGSVGGRLRTRRGLGGHRPVEALGDAFARRGQQRELVDGRAGPAHALVQRLRGAARRGLQRAHRAAGMDDRGVELADGGFEAFLAAAHGGETPLQHDAIDQRDGEKAGQREFDDQA
ncbi:MAG: hypothetical protein WDM81_19330 [Rhizomicrobium sp.]